MKKLTLSQAILIVIMVFLTLTMIIPVLHIFARSISDPTLSTGMTTIEILPRGFSAINYKVLFSNKHVLPSILNSLFITLVGTLLNMALTIMAAYALTRPGLVGKQVFMVFFIIMMLFDPGIVPEYMVVRKVGLIGSQWSVILVAAMNVYYLVIMMRYFEAVPTAIYEAATIDGAGHWTMLTQIACPLAMSGIATLTMFYGVLRWNEYFKAGVYISSIDKVPLQVILRKFVVDADITTIIGTQNLMNYNDLAKIDYTAVQYATIILAIVPILLVYPLVLKFYAKEVMAGSVKE